MLRSQMSNISESQPQDEDDAPQNLNNLFKAVLGGNVKSSNLYTAKSIPGYQKDDSSLISRSSDTLNNNGLKSKKSKVIKQNDTGLDDVYEHPDEDLDESVMITSKRKVSSSFMGGKS